MTTTSLVILGLGVVHGVNPGMGWLFAVALGLQEQERRAVWRSLLPLALGHALAIGGAVTVGLALGGVVPTAVLRWVVALILCGFGIERIIRGRHPRWVGMRVGFRDLTLWSLLMASAHGAGLMVLPFLLGVPEGGAASGPHAHQGAMMAHSTMGGALPLQGVVATLLHTVGYLLVTALVAVVVYERLGLRLLQHYWINLDLIWGVALVATGVLTVLM
jgi:hypothetical protein